MLKIVASLTFALVVLAPLARADDDAPDASVARARAEIQRLTKELERLLDADAAPHATGVGEIRPANVTARAQELRRRLVARLVDLAPARDGADRPAPARPPRAHAERGKDAPKDARSDVPPYVRRLAEANHRLEQRVAALEKHVQNLVRALQQRAGGPRGPMAGDMRGGTDRAMPGPMGGAMRMRGPRDGDRGPGGMDRDMGRGMGRDMDHGMGPGMGRGMGPGMGPGMGRGMRGDEDRDEAGPMPRRERMAGARRAMMRTRLLRALFGDGERGPGRARGDDDAPGLHMRVRAPSDRRGEGRGRGPGRRAARGPKGTPADHFARIEDLLRRIDKRLARLVEEERSDK